jgi:hypothetical protein
MSITDQIQDTTVHHAANAAAIVIPTMSLGLNGPAILTWTTALLGCIWYAILIGEKIAGWIRRRKSSA